MKKNALNLTQLIQINAFELADTALFSKTSTNYPWLMGLMGPLGFIQDPIVMVDPVDDLRPSATP